jgi:hypothetical protein
MSLRIRTRVVYRREGDHIRWRSSIVIHGRLVLAIRSRSARKLQCSSNRARCGDLEFGVTSHRQSWGWLARHDFSQKVLLPVRISGRLIIAQQFTAGIRRKGSESVERTADDKGPILSACFSIVRFTDYHRVTADPTDKSLGYSRSSADADWEKDFLCQAARHLR